MSEEGTRKKVATVDELEAGSRVITEVDGREIAVFDLGGEYHALLNYCVHQAGPLCEGPIEGRHSVTSFDDDQDWEWRYDDDPSIIACPWHTWRFDITTGQSIDDDRYAVPTYDVEVENDEIFIVL